MGDPTTPQTLATPTEGPALPEISHSLSGVTKKVAESLEKQDIGFTEDGTKKVFPMLMGGAVAVAGIAFFKPLDWGSKKLFSGLKTLVTGGGALEKIPVFGMVFSALGEAVETIGSFMAYIIPAAAGVIGYKAFEVKQEPTPPPPPPGAGRDHTEKTAMALGPAAALAAGGVGASTSAAIAQQRATHEAAQKKAITDAEAAVAANKPGLVTRVARPVVKLMGMGAKGAVGLVTLPLRIIPGGPGLANGAMASMDFDIASATLKAAEGQLAAARAAARKPFVPTNAAPPPVQTQPTASPPPSSVTLQTPPSTGTIPSATSNTPPGVVASGTGQTTITTAQATAPTASESSSPVTSPASPPKRPSRIGEVTTGQVRGFAGTAAAATALRTWLDWDRTKPEDKALAIGTIGVGGTAAVAPRLLTGRIGRWIPGVGAIFSVFDAKEQFEKGNNFNASVSSAYTGLGGASIFAQKIGAVGRMFLGRAFIVTGAVSGAKDLYQVGDGVYAIEKAKSSIDSVHTLDTKQFKNANVAVQAYLREQLKSAGVNEMNWGEVKILDTSDGTAKPKIRQAIDSALNDAKQTMDQNNYKALPRFWAFTDSQEAAQKRYEEALSKYHLFDSAKKELDGYFDYMDKNINTHRLSERSSSRNSNGRIIFEDSPGELGSLDTPSVPNRSLELRQDPLTPGKPS